MSENTSQGGQPPPNAGAGGSGWVQGFSPLASGGRVGELIIQSVLGAGEFGITYLTEHQKTNKRYALKEYFPRDIAYRDGPTVRARAATATAYAWGLERFLTEGRAVQKLKHPSLVSILGITETSGTGYVGMTYEQGQDFDIWLHGHQRIAPQEELDKIVGPLLQGLDLAHGSKLLHLDIGPECVMVRENGTPVLVDFGGFRVGLRRRLNVAASQVKPYAAPELVAGDGSKIGPWTDLYAVAGLLYLAVSGKAPPSVAEREAGGSWVPTVTAAQGRYRRDFLLAIDAGLALSSHERPKAAGPWRDQLLNTRTSRFGFSKTAAPATPAPSAPPSAPKAAPASVAARAASVQPVAAPVAAAAMRDPAERRFSAPRDDAAAPAETPADAAPLMENIGFRSIFYGATGLLAGTVGGGLASILVASILRPECSGDNCITPFVLPLGVIGALVGAWAGVIYSKQTISQDKPPAGGGY